MTKKNIQQIAEELDWTVTWDDYSVMFSKFSPCGQDFNIEIYFDKVSEIRDKIYEYYRNYDPSYEAYLWLDDSGHGKNGAPYEMVDVYNDMKDCESMILQLYQALEGSE